MSITLDGNTLTNTETNQTYTYGKRGRRPAWVQEYEKKHGAPVKPTTTPVESKVEPSEYEITQKGNTIYNKTLKTSYKLGQRGRKPAWVLSYLAEQNGGEVPAPKEKTVDPVTIKRHASGLREWVFRNESKLDGQAIIVAHDEIEARQLFSKCVKYADTPTSFAYFWHEVEYGETFKIGYWRYNKETNEWYKPEPKAIPQPATIAE